MWRAALVGLVACGDGTVPPVDVLADPHETFAIDVVVDQSMVRVYLVGVDRTACTQENDRFPGLGSCVANTDENTCLQAEPCVHRDVALLTSDQTRDAGDYMTGRTTTFSFDAAAHPEAEVVITGCGGQAHIPLGSGTLPTATVSAQRDPAGTITVTWSGASRALLDFGGATFTGYACLTGDSPYVFTPPDGDPNHFFQEAAVWTFAGATTIATELGMARVWRGGVSGATIAP